MVKGISKPEPEPETISKEKYYNPAPEIKKSSRDLSAERIHRQTDLLAAQ